MVRYVSRDSTLVFNAARQKACGALSRVLEGLEDRDGVTETALRDSWLCELVSEGNVMADGWYCPPPRGAAVLFGSRVNFDSLRNPAFWSSDAVAYENGDMLYAYCSPVDRNTGLIGDMSVTMYLGQDERIRDHVKRCHDATGEVFSALDSVESPAELFRLSGEIFRKHGLYSGVISRTDSMPSNLGHTFPIDTEVIGKKCLTIEDCMRISGSRLFLNGAAEWDFSDGLQFTIEPQLLSLDDPSLPKITQHYLVHTDSEGFTVCDDIDSILREFGQI